MVNIPGMKMFAEFLGTFVLAVSIEFITVYDEDTQSNLLMAILAGFFIAITITREISGGHINPGVTTAIYLAEKDHDAKNEQANQMWMYVVAQTGGVICAALLGLVLYNEHIFRLAPHYKTYSSEALVLEILGSTIFYSMILIQGDKDAKLCGDKTLSTLTITAALATGIAVSGNISGGCLNPALGFGFNFARLLTTGKIEECKYLWVYLIGPLAGAFLASSFYKNVFRRYWELENENIENKKNLLELNDI
jgi:glycerol uptake facilitator-like aquaporin